MDLTYLHGLGNDFLITFTDDVPDEGSALVDSVTALAALGLMASFLERRLSTVGWLSTSSTVMEAGRR